MQKVEKKGNVRRGGRWEREVRRESVRSGCRLEARGILRLTG